MTPSQLYKQETQNGKLKAEIKQLLSTKALSRYEAEELIQLNVLNEIENPRKINQSEIKRVKQNHNMTASEKLDTIAKLYTNNGFEVVDRDRLEIQLFKKKKFSYMSAFLWFLLLGVGLVIYILYYLIRGDDNLSISVEDNYKEKPQVEEDTQEEPEEVTDISETEEVVKEEEFLEESAQEIEEEENGVKSLDEVTELLENEKTAQEETTLQENKVEIVQEQKIAEPLEKSIDEELEDIIDIPEDSKEIKEDIEKVNEKQEEIIDIQKEPKEMKKDLSKERKKDTQQSNDDELDAILASLENELVQKDLKK